MAYGGMGTAYSMLGEPEVARRAFDACRDVIRTTTLFLDMEYGELIRLTHYHLIYQTEDVAERHRLVAEIARVWALGSGALPGEYFPALGGLQVLFIDGMWDDLRELIAAGPLIVPNQFYHRPVVGNLAHASGDTAEAWALVENALPYGPATEPGATILITSLAFQRLAALALDASDHATARAWLEAHDRWIDWSGTVPGRAEGHVLRASYYRAIGDFAQASVHADQALADASQPRQPLALLAAHRMRGVLATDAGAYREADDHFAAALALADACLAP